MALDAPACLWLLLIVPAFLSAFLWSIRCLAAWQETFSGERKRRYGGILHGLLLCLVLALVSVAFARPKIQYTRTVFNRSGIDVVVGIDVSKSMLAEDVSLPAGAEQAFQVPNRLNRARQFALDLLSRLRGERIGVFLFASNGIEVIPFTRDYGFSRYVLTYIKDAEITVPGSDLGEAIRTGLFMFEDDGGKAARILVLLSDGEDTGLEPSHVSESVLLAAGKGVKVFTVGLGTGKSVRIPMRDEAGARVVNAYIDEEGNPLKTRLEQERLKTIANATGGTYVAATEENAAAVVMDAILKEAREAEYTQGEEQAWWGLAPLLFLAGFLLFAWGMWIGR